MRLCSERLRLVVWVERDLEVRVFPSGGDVFHGRPALVRIGLHIDLRLRRNVDVPDDRLLRDVRDVYLAAEHVEDGLPEQIARGVVGGAFPRLGEWLISAKCAKWLMQNGKFRL